MKYNLGCMDTYPIEAVGSVIANCPMFRVVFKNFIDPIRLDNSIREAIKHYPLFGTSVEFEKGYYLKTNELPLILLNTSENDRPNTFGKNTNRYPWRIIYHEKTLCFEWLHGVSDGVGALDFLKQILLAYFDCKLENKSTNFLVAPGLEPFFDNKEKGKNYKLDPKGFNHKKLPCLYKDYKADCHVLRCETQEVLSLAKACDSSVIPVLAILFSQAIRKHLPAKLKNRSVAANIDLDLRRPLKYETMHNCVNTLRLTYLDEYDKLNFKAIAKIYKEKLDHGRIPENIIRGLTSRVNTFRIVHLTHNKKLLKLIYKIGGPIFKYDDCNFVVTYLGKIDLPDSIIEKIENIDIKSWPDGGDCVLAALDYNGKFNLNISDNFKEKGIVEDFILLAKQLGINFDYQGYMLFEQSQFEE